MVLLLLRRDIEAFKRHQQHHDKSLWKLEKCSLCDFVTHEDHLMKSHRQQHLKGTALKCETCRFYTIGENRMALHRTVHTGKKILKWVEGIGSDLKIFGRLIRSFSPRLELVTMIITLSPTDAATATSWPSTLAFSLITWRTILLDLLTSKLRKIWSSNAVNAISADPG